MKQKENSLRELTTITSKKNKVEKNEKIKLVLPSSLIGDIEFLHTKYRGTEWSGYLYYTFEGTIENPSEMTINIEDFVLLDVGTPGFTDIRPTPEQVVTMFDKRPDIITKGYKQGLLHTH